MATLSDGWKKRSPERVAAYNKKYYYAHLEKFKSYRQRAKQKRLALGISSYSKEAYERNKESWALKERERIAKLPRHIVERRRREHGLRPYSISQKDFEAIADSQNNLCAICLRPEKLFVDHDHKTGRVRGLVCNNCNLVLGHMRASVFAYEEYLNHDGITK